MCGITGYIGKSTNPDITHELATALFLMAESRGADASGFWATEQGDGGGVIYHKEPVKASEFVKRPIWRDVVKFSPNLMLIHARGASTGYGAPAVNQNNHPFVSNDKTVALIHNGRIPDSEYNDLRKKYDVLSKCDSEILLRMLEASAKDGSGVETRLDGLKSIWSQIVRGHMAVGIGERLDGSSRRLWVFRNKHRPLWLADLRLALGQVFFFSAPEMWQRALMVCPNVHPFIHRGKTKIVELRTEQIWCLEVSDECPVLEDKHLNKYDVVQEGYSNQDFSGPIIPVTKKAATVHVVTKLADDDTVAGDEKSLVKVTVEDKKEDKAAAACSGAVSPTHSVVKPISTPLPRTEYPALMTGGVKLAVAANATKDAAEKEDQKERDKKVPSEEEGNTIIRVEGKEVDNMEFDIKLETLEEEAEKIKTVVSDIVTLCQNRQIEGSLTPHDYTSLLASMETCRMELDGTLSLVEKS